MLLSSFYCQPTDRFAAAPAACTPTANGNATSTPQIVDPDFCCLHSDAQIAWLQHLLQVTPTADGNASTPSSEQHVLTFIIVSFVFYRSLGCSTCSKSHPLLMAMHQHHQSSSNSNKMGGVNCCSASFQITCCLIPCHGCHSSSKGELSVCMCNCLCKERMSLQLLCLFNSCSPCKLSTKYN